MKRTRKAPARRSKSKARINPAFARYALRVARSPIQGYGVYAEEGIPRRKRVIEYTGEKIPAKEGTRRAIRRWREGSRRVVIFRLSSRWCLDADVGGSGAELVNHSCAPNLETRKNRGRIYYYCRRTIRAGEELTVDYRFEADAIQVPCKCGAPSCRGTINLKPKRNRKRHRSRRA
jgi:uncharacterized protein